MVCVITYFNYITTHTFPLGSEKGMSYYIFTMVCPNTEYVLLSILPKVLMLPFTIVSFAMDVECIQSQKRGTNVWFALIMTYVRSVWKKE